MSTAFADAFYWIALATPLDAAHERAKKFTDDIVTTQEVLTDYLNFFLPARSIGAGALRKACRRFYMTQRCASFHRLMVLFTLVSIIPRYAP